MAHSFRKSRQRTIPLPTGKAFSILLAFLVVGTLGCLALILAALIAMSYLAALTIGAIQEALAAFAALYAGCDSFGRLIIWLVFLFLLFKLSPVIRQSALRTISAFWR